MKQLSRWGLVGALIAVIVAALLMLRPRARLDAPPPLAQAAERPAAAASAAEPGPVPAVTTTACPGEALSLELDGVTAVACVGEARVRERGNLTSYVVVLAERRGRLTVDRSGDKIIGARLQLADNRRFSCDIDTCAGITLSPVAQDGVRTLTLHETTFLGRTSGTGPGSTPAGIVSGTVAVRERVRGEVACDSARLSMTESSGSVREFCPMGGAGFEVTEDEGREYRFDALNGDSLRLRYDAGGHLQTIRLTGQVSAVCQKRECAGLRHLGPSAGLEDAFEFGGVALLGKGNAVSTLSGRLEMPASE